MRKFLGGFERALIALKCGWKVQREDWEDDQFVASMERLKLPPFSSTEVPRVNARTAKYIGEDTPLESLPYLAVFDGKYWQVGWAPSQGEMLVARWYILQSDDDLLNDPRGYQKAFGSEGLQVIPEWTGEAFPGDLDGEEFPEGVSGRTPEEVEGEECPVSLEELTSLTMIRDKGEFLGKAPQVVMKNLRGFKDTLISGVKGFQEGLARERAKDREDFASFKQWAELKVAELQARLKTLETVQEAPKDFGGNPLESERAWEVLRAKELPRSYRLKIDPREMTDKVREDLSEVCKAGSILQEVIPVRESRPLANLGPTSGLSWEAIIALDLTFQTWNPRTSQDQLRECEREFESRFGVHRSQFRRALLHCLGGHYEAGNWIPPIPPSRGETLRFEARPELQRDSLVKEAEKLLRGYPDSPELQGEGTVQKGGGMSSMERDKEARERERGLKAILESAGATIDQNGRILRVDSVSQRDLEELRDCGPDSFGGSDYE